METAVHVAGAVKEISLIDSITATSLWWDRTELYSQESADGRCPMAIDVTGRRRYLAYGPYQVLGAGLWRASVQFTLCPDAAKRRFSIDFGTEKIFTTVEVPVGVIGVNTVDIIQSISEGDACEIRVMLRGAAFHGTLQMIGVSLSKVVDLDETP